MKALLIVDMQNDFMPGGPLGVKGADEIVSIINILSHKFPLVVASMDWHPANHVSFASSHLGKKVGEYVDTDNDFQLLWPVHCVCDTQGAELVPGLERKNISHFFHKGVDRDIDSYSAFFDNARKKSTGLGDYLKKLEVTDLYLVGVATDYCVLYSSLDAIDLGFAVHVIQDACRPVNINSHDEELAWAAIAAKGGMIVKSTDL